MPVALAAALLLAVGANRVVAPEVEARRVQTTIDNELALYPSGTLLGPATCGYQNVVADALWFRAIQYYGEHRKTDLVFDKAAHVFRVLTDLDPHFVGAYRFGALVVIEDAGDREAGLEILRKGMRWNQGRWELAFDLGFHHFRKGEFDRAVFYFRRAALWGGEERVARFAAYAEKRRGGLDESEELWREILATTDNDRFREAARFALSGIRAARDTAFLAERARAFRGRHTRFPHDLEEMVRDGVLSRIPEEPYGGRYVVQPFTGEVRSSFLLDREIARDVRVLQAVADRFRAVRGRPARDLDEMVEAGLIAEIPSPWGIRYGLDGGSGRVRALPITPEEAAGTGGDGETKRRGAPCGS